MPKISRSGGPSNAAAEPEPVLVEVGEQSSPGNSSSASPEKPESSVSEKIPSPGSPARATGSPSGKGRTASGSARGTGGGRTAKGSK